MKVEVAPEEETTGELALEIHLGEAAPRPRGSERPCLQTPSVQ